MIDEIESQICAIRKVLLMDSNCQVCNQTDRRTDRKKQSSPATLSRSSGLLLVLRFYLLFDVVPSLANVHLGYPS